MNDNEGIHCRLCAELKPNNKLIDLQAEHGQCQEIVAKLTRFNVQMNLHDDILPKAACFTCVNSLRRAFEFISAVEQAQFTLNDLILKRQIKKEENVSDDENFVYEGPMGYENNVENIKIEFEKTHSPPKSSLEKNAENSSDRKKKKYIFNSLDTVPLSQLKMSWKNYDWLCAHCGTQFPTSDELLSHSMQYHNACNSYRCTDCKMRKFRLDTFLQHVKRHRKYLKFSCYRCYRNFATLTEASKHMAEHKVSDHVCCGCNTNFKSQEELAQHTSTYYRTIRRAKTSAKLKSDSLTCTVCEKTFKNKSSLSSHLLIHTNRKKDHTCEICGKCFYFKGSLVTHMVLHSDAKPHQCEICKSSFKTQRQLRKHVGIHDGDKPFPCDQCGKCFRLKSHLVNHSIIHTDSLPHVCSYCNKSFRFKTILNQHVRQHTGVKPYSCSICKRDFTNWPNYNKHMKRKHGTNMAKKKHTPDGAYPIDPTTGEVIYPDKLSEWKMKMMEQRPQGRPRVNSKAGKGMNKNSNNNE